MFDLRQSVEEVCDIMKFQVEQKGLDLKLFISADVPNTVFSDLKRFK
jgi:signal transduction histidine kinase